MAAGDLAAQAPNELARNQLTRSPTHEDSAAGGDVPKPVYSNVYGQMDLTEGGLDTQAAVTADGRVNININERTPRLLSIFKPPAIKFPTKPQPSAHIPLSLRREERETLPRLNIVIHVVGSRGDVQPFVALGQVLHKVHGHRVRLATHPTFKQFVEENGLEFFSIGGDPAKLMAFMVKNPGLMPGMDALRNGDIHERRVEIATIISGCWRSCFEAGDGTGVPVSDAMADSVNFLETSPPFVADAIIANPPSFAHVHCAEKLGIPLHLMFTMPWSPTQAFPHPLASIQGSTADMGITNYVSYAVVELMTWQGLGDIINRFRERSLGLEPISIMWAPAMIPRMRIPYTYCWSPALIPKPNDWASHINISGFYFLSLASNYTPPSDLAAFLAAGSPPVYIGFGSIVVDDPNQMTKLIFDAVRQTGQRALVSKGWGGLGADELDIPDGVFMLGNCPHDWLFQYVSCVVHHGGAGTTAAGIALGRPTVIVPFFGDQPFWGSMVAKAGAGPDPIAYKQLTADRLAAAIMQALQPASSTKAAELGAKIRGEKGIDVGVDSFHHQLNIDKMRCNLMPDRVAVFRIKRTNIRLSALAFAVLSASGQLGLEDVKLYRSKEHITEPEPPEPVIGGGAAMLGNIGELIMGFADVPLEIKRGFDKCPSRSPSRHRRSSSQAMSQEAANAESRPDSPLPKATPESAHDSDTTTATAPRQEGNTAAQSLPESGRASPEDSTAGSSSNGPKLDPNNDCAKSSRLSQEPQVQNDLSKGNARAEEGRQPNKIDLDAVVNAGKTAAKIFNMGFKAPTSFTMAVAKGFHNAPLLYGDETVRESNKITGIKSGLKAAGREFGYGFYDGISGLAMHPMSGAKKEGAAGAIKGFGKGIGGLVFKPAAGVWALPGYTMNGIYKEIQKRFGESVDNYIMTSRCAQGMAEYKSSTSEEREAILERWETVQMDVAKRKTHHSRGSEADKEKTPKNSGKDMEAEKAAGRANRRQAFRELFRPRDFSPRRRQVRSSTLPAEYEDAIQHSVHVTSKGNVTEDEMIERALRASVLELRAAEAAGEEEQQAYNRAIDASIREAECVLQEKAAAKKEALKEVSGEEQALSVERSLPRRPQLPPRDIATHISHSDDADDADLQRALTESRQTYEEVEKRALQDHSEMDVVMEYIKRQSLAELEYERQRTGTADQVLLPPSYSQAMAENHTPDDEKGE